MNTDLNTFANSIINKTFELLWKNQKKEIIHGQTIIDAFRDAGYVEKDLHNLKDYHEL